MGPVGTPRRSPRLPRMDASEAALAERIAATSGGTVELVAWTLSSEDRWAAALLRVRGTDNWLEAVSEFEDGTWTEWATGSGSEAWSPIETRDGVVVGAFRLYGQAPAGAARALVSWRGETHEVPVQNGYFAFASWDASDVELIRTPPEPAGFVDAAGNQVAGEG